VAADDLSGSPRRYLAVAQDLLTAISRGEYAPGERLPAHTEVAAKARVSRATAREAFLALELIGAIEVRHGDGTFVRSTPHLGGTHGSLLDAPQELIECRLYLEPVVAGLVADRIRPDQLTQLEENLASQSNLVNRPDQVTKFVSLGLQFHADLAPACGNSLLADMARQLVNVEHHPLWALVNQQALPNTDSRQTQVDEHRAVLHAIRQRNSEAAAEAMRLHLQALGSSLFDRS
jgi:DNA-binding FadR family transcriptional regulator